ncbi:hypothetical protein MASR1M12_15520 [Erysipelotrichia bacterium]
MEPIQNIQGEITDKKAKDKRRGWKNNRDKRKIVSYWSKALRQGSAGKRQVHGYLGVGHSKSGQAKKIKLRKRKNSHQKSGGQSTGAAF